MTKIRSMLVDRARRGARPAGFRGPGAPCATALYDRLQAGDPPAGGRLYTVRRTRALLRKEGLYSSHVVTWRQQREAGLTPKKRGRKMTAVDPQRKKLEQENRRLTARLQKAEALLAFKKKFPNSYRSP